MGKKYGPLSAKKNGVSLEEGRDRSGGGQSEQHWTQREKEVVASPNSRERGGFLRNREKRRGNLGQTENIFQEKRWEVPQVHH